MDSEQFSAGGLDTVRGYLESEVLGDNAAVASLELRSPSFIGTAKEKANEWRVYGFVEGGQLYVNSPLPGEERTHDLASVGIGTRFRYLDHITGSLDMGVPLVTQPNAIAHDLYFTFRLGVDF